MLNHVLEQMPAHGELCAYLIRAAMFCSVKLFNGQRCFDAGIGVRAYITDEEEQLIRLENRFETRKQDQDYS